MTVLSELIYKFNVISIKIPAVFVLFIFFFCKNDKLIRNLCKITKLGYSHFLNSNQDGMGCHKDRCIDKWTRTDSPAINLWAIDFQQECQEKLIGREYSFQQMV